MFRRWKSLNQTSKFKKVLVSFSPSTGRREKFWRNVLWRKKEPNKKHERIWGVFLHLCDNYGGSFEPEQAIEIKQCYFKGGVLLDKNG